MLVLPAIVTAMVATAARLVRSDVNAAAVRTIFGTHAPKPTSAIQSAQFWGTRSGETVPHGASALISSAVTQAVVPLVGPEAPAAMWALTPPGASSGELLKEKGMSCLSQLRLLVASMRVHPDPWVYPVWSANSGAPTATEDTRSVSQFRLWLIPLHVHPELWADAMRAERPGAPMALEDMNCGVPPGPCALTECHQCQRPRALTYASELVHVLAVGSRLVGSSKYLLRAGTVGPSRALGPAPRLLRLLGKMLPAAIALFLFQTQKLSRIPSKYSAQGYSRTL